MAMAFIELVIGLSFLYLLLAIAGSAIIEWHSQRRGDRGRYLREGLLNLLEDRWFYLRIINHPTLQTLYREVQGRPRPPSYVEPTSFATALLDVVVTKASKLDPAANLNPAAAQTNQTLTTAAQICAQNGFAVGSAVLPLVSNAATIEDAKAAVGKWYTATMDRVGGWYKAATQKRLIFVGFILAVVFNVNSMTISWSLLTNSSLRAAVADFATAAAPDLAKQVGKEAQEIVQEPKIATAPGSSDSAASSDKAPEDTKAPPKEPIDQLKDMSGKIYELKSMGLPIGYSCLGAIGNEKETKSGIDAIDSCWKAVTAVKTPFLVLQLVGWFITAFAVSFGAQFWFDLLNKFINLRGAGAKPKAD